MLSVHENAGHALVWVEMSLFTCALAPGSKSLKLIAHVLIQDFDSSNLISWNSYYIPVLIILQQKSLKWNNLRHLKLVVLHSALRKRFSRRFVGTCFGNGCYIHMKIYQYLLSYKINGLHLLNFLLSSFT